MAQRLTDQLEVRGGRIHCNRCEADLCASHENYKLWCLQEVVPIEDAPGGGDPSPYEMRDTLELRRFYCPGCVRQLAVEVAPLETPPLWDVELSV